jgi:G1/S-specific cyclin PLC1
MESTRLLTREQLKEAALNNLITSRVDSRLISHLSRAADTVIPCDKNIMPAQHRKHTPASLPTPPTTPELRAVQPEDPMLPTVEQFIRQLVRSSNVQTATLMPTLIYLQRLKNKLQPMSRGLRCTSHRIFLACLILAAKYVNDISPKNKHWARYTNMEGPSYNFGFCTSEVNLMEKQLLQLLDFDLRFTEEDLYNTWQDYLEPMRQKLEDDNRRTYLAWHENTMRATPQYSPRYYPQYERYTRASSGSVSPPALSYASSSASSTSSSRPSSRATTPTSIESGEYTAMYTPSHYGAYEYPSTTAAKGQRKRLLPYEIPNEQALAHSVDSRNAKIPRASRGVFSRVFGSAMMAR